MVESVRASGGVRAATPTRDSTKTAEGQFSVEEHLAPLTQNARVSNVASIGIESLLTLQAHDEKAERNQRARKRGTAMVAALGDLQRATLAEEDPERALHALDELAADIPDADDPVLGSILRAIALRSRVELARRKR